MLYGLLLALFIFVCFSLVLLVLIQKGKGSMGLGSIGGGTQMLFGGSGGQDLFQKITWTLGAIFMGGSLILGLMKSSTFHDVRYIKIKETPQAEAENKQALPLLDEEPEAAEQVAPEAAAPVTQEAFPAAQPQEQKEPLNVTAEQPSKAPEVEAKPAAPAPVKPAEAKKPQVAAKPRTVQPVKAKPVQAKQQAKQASPKPA